MVRMTVELSAYGLNDSRVVGLCDRIALLDLVSSMVEGDRLSTSSSHLERELESSISPEVTAVRTSKDLSGE
jgi:hypothetical protein